MNDSTMEALGETLMDNPTGLLVYRDELAGLFEVDGQGGQEGARTFYLQGFDGNQPMYSTASDGAATCA